MRPDEWWDSLAYNFLVDREFAKIAELAGCEWAKMPPELLATKLMRTALEDPSKFNIVKDQLLALKPNNDPIPFQEEPLRLELNRQLAICRYKALAALLAAQPERGATILAGFEPDAADGVVACSIGDSLDYYIEAHLQRLRDGVAEITIPGFERVSRMIGGFNPEQVVLITAKTGYGKTNLGINLAIQGASQWTVAFVNMEMSLDDINKRIYVIGTDTPYDDWKAGKIDERKKEKLKALIGDRLRMTNGRSLTLQSIENWARRMKRESRDLRLLFVDYDQKIEVSVDRHTPEWAAMHKAMMRLDNLSKELKICIVVFAQVDSEGRIASSKRAQNPMTTILSFERTEGGADMIRSVKTRHAPDGNSVCVNYSRSSNRITEQSPELAPPTPPTPVSLRKGQKGSHYPKR